MLTGLETKILVIEHDQDFLNIAHEKLSARGFTVFAVQTAEEAILILKREIVEAVLIDFYSSNSNCVMISDYINDMKKKPILLSLQNQAKNEEGQKSASLLY